MDTSGVKGITEYSGVDWTETTGARLYRKARKLIPGGVQLLSKRPERFLPRQWPAYFSKARGCEIWDLDGRHFYDTTIHCVGACLLGYADPDVNAAVQGAIDRGNMSTLNSPAEVELAELFCELHPWADMVRYARAGGETMSVAVRIARAATGRETVAFCGYHGWSDWYLAANLGDHDALDGLLMPGLNPTGVPRSLAGTALPFHYNRIDELEAIIDRTGGKLAAIITEPLRDVPPQDGFLHRIRELADQIGAVMIIDEISAGWRFCLGGAHLTLDVEPDLAAYSKSTSNGYPMGAVIGRREVMEAAQSSFISSTYWTDAVGPTAAVAAIRKMERVRLSEHTMRVGAKVHDGWRELARRHGIHMKPHGQYPMSHMAFGHGEKNLALQALMTQEMLDRGYLSTGAFTVSLAHTDEVIDGYLAALDEVLAVLKQALRKDDLESRLKGPLPEQGFGRLT